MMSERMTAKQFCREIDDIHVGQVRLLDGAGRLSSALAEMDVARSMIEADFTPASATLSALQEHVRQRVGAWATELEARKSSVARRVLRFMLRPAPLAIASICLALVLIQCAAPGGIPAVERAIRAAIVSYFQVGKGTAVQTVDYSKIPPLPALPEPYWRMNTAGGGVGAPVPEGAPMNGWHFDNYAAARAAAPAFPFLVPAAIPDGYRLFEVVLSPDRHWLVGSYSHASQSGFAFIAHEVSGDGETVAGTGSPAEIVHTAVRSAPAAWLGGRLLVWEQGTVSYALGGDSLTLGEATRIADSLRQVSP